MGRRAGEPPVGSARGGTEPGGPASRRGAANPGETSAGELERSSDRSRPRAAEHYRKAAEAERHAPPASVLSDVAVQALLTGTWEDAAPPAKEGSDGSNP